MARQASQAKMGFYPADPIAIEAILKHLKLPPSGSKGIYIIDPCCGEGRAINQIANGLGVPQDQVYAVELDGNRAQIAKDLMPEANVCGPASFMGMKITSYSYSLAYVNPPFDAELGGGRREEHVFVEQAYRILAPGGTMVLVCPVGALNGNRDFCMYIDSRFENVQMYVFPSRVRNFKEIVVFGTKRKTPISADMIYQVGDIYKSEFHFRTYMDWTSMLSEVGVPRYKQYIAGRHHDTLAANPYTAVPAWKPAQFHKSNYLPEELVEAVERSPLNLLLEEVEQRKLRRPPLPPGKGHVALLLASGMLDGVVPAGEDSHVVRGTAKKVEYLNEAASTSEEAPNGALTTKDVYSQKVVLVIRAAWQDGTIQTFSDQPELNAAGEKEEGDAEEEAA